MSRSISRRVYADLYGPTTRDRVRLADTDLVLEVERDFTVYGDEITFGGGKTIRDGMGQSARALRESRPGALDLVITNALIIDHWGIVKGDIGVRDGRIVKVGKAGNPDTMEGVDPEFDQAGPARVKALVLVKAPAWPLGPGDPDAGLASARRAVSLKPQYPANVLALAEALAKTGDEAGARENYLRARDLAQGLAPSSDRDDWLREAQQALGKLPRT